MTKEEIKKLYNDKDYKLMFLANESIQHGKSRVDEIKTFAHKTGVKRIGIANCVAVQKEADKLEKMLSDEFEVYSINCKVGQIQRSEFLGEGATGISCNPAGQAEHLEQKETELNISFGLCMGHDILFNLKSKAPVTTLIVKDRKHKHNPIQIFSD